MLRGGRSLGDAAGEARRDAGLAHDRLMERGVGRGEGGHVRDLERRQGAADGKRRGCCSRGLGHGRRWHRSPNGRRGGGRVLRLEVMRPHLVPRVRLRPPIEHRRAVRAPPGAGIVVCVEEVAVEGVGGAAVVVALPADVGLDFLERGPFRPRLRLRVVHLGSPSV